MNILTRRELIESSLRGLLAYGFLRECFIRSAFAAPVKTTMDKWQKQLYEICQDAKSQSISLVDWQKKTDELFAHISQEDLIRYVKLEKLIKSIEHPEAPGVFLREATLPKLQAFPGVRPVFHLFAYQKKTAIPPHAHNNVLAAQLVLEGKLRSRTFNRIKDEKDHLLISQTQDLLLKSGDINTMSDDQDNVHWFLGSSERVHTFHLSLFDVITEKTYVTKACDEFGQIFIDPTVGKAKNGLVHAKIISWDNAVAKFARADRW